MRVRETRVLSAHLELALVHHEEAGVAAPLRQQRVTAGEDLLLHGHRDGLQLTERRRLQRRHAPQVVQPLRHAHALEHLRPHTVPEIRLSLNLTPGKGSAFCEPPVSQRVARALWT